MQFTPTPKFIPNPPKPLKVYPLAEERRLRLIELANEAFPDGEAPALFASALSQDEATNVVELNASNTRIK